MQNRYSENIGVRIEISARIWQFYNVSKTQVRKSEYLTNCSRHEPVLCVKSKPLKVDRLH